MARNGDESQRDEKDEGEGVKRQKRDVKTRAESLLDERLEKRVQNSEAYLPESAAQVVDQRKDEKEF